MRQSSNLTRRGLFAGAASGALVLALAGPASALDTASARVLIGRLVDDINRIINSGESEQAMFKDFQGLFAKYADVPIIARSTLGVAARSASASEMAAYTKAFEGYLARKYGKRFREFIGGKIEVKSAQAVNGFFEVDSTAILRGQAPFDVKWDVSNRSGRDVFFNIVIEGVNMLATERQEIGSLLDRNGGNIMKLVADLQKAG